MKNSFHLFLFVFVVFVIVACRHGKKNEAAHSDTLAIRTTEELKVTSDAISAQSMGMAYLEENDLDNAEIQFKKLIELSPNNSSGYANLGVVYLRQGNIGDAEKMLKKAIEISPNDPDIILNLAKVYELKNQEDASLEVLKKSENISPDHVKTLYSIAEKFEGQADSESIKLWENYMIKIVDTSPKNIVARLYLIEALIRSNNGDDALKNLEEIQQISSIFSAESMEYLEEATELLQNGNTKQALTPILIFHNFQKLTSEYQGGIRELKGAQNATVGVPVISMNTNTSFRLEDGESILDVIKFTEATQGAELDFFSNDMSGEDKVYISSLSIADMDGDGDYDIYFAGYHLEDKEPFRFLLQSEYGRYQNIINSSGIKHEGMDQSSSFVDFDNDGFLDLFICSTQANKLYRNVNKGVFEDVSSTSNITGTGNSTLFFDLDHEGDLDIMVAKNGNNLVFRNNGDGSFTDMESMLSKDTFNTSEIKFGDFDNDGDIDIVIANKNGPVQLFSNSRQGNFVEITTKSNIEVNETINIEVADIDNDGDLDLLLVTLKDGVMLFVNNGEAKFSKSESTQGIQEHLSGLEINDAAIFDFDNDGYEDIMLTGNADTISKTGTILLHNDGYGFKDATYLLPESIINGKQIALADYNQDGDIDVFMVESNGAIKLLRNDGGNANRHLRLQLVGLRTGSGKNNYYGIGATVEVRAGDLYQMKMITKPGLHFGLGQREKADVVRIMWTNGVPQHIFSPGSDQDLIEEQELKGSCPFLYTWNGKEYVFVKDMMWRSALGMPLGIMGGKQAYAFADASEEYLKIPGELLQPKDGKYTIQMTEELWETIYADEIKLIAVDHPTEAEIYVDEKFAAPPYPELRIFKVNDHHSPISARDGKGNDVKPLIAKKDHRYISNFQRMKFQGITEMKDLVLDLGDIEDTENLHLFLNGWIFPTDASINVALSQSDAISIKHPSLEVINQQGAWEEVIPSIGFPSGKNKTVIVDLTDKFLSEERKVRIRTNMEIYWDYIFFAHDEEMEMEMEQMSPASADYHYRGFSAKSRKGGRYGPHWFDYSEVTAGQKWRDLTGTYTRYGDVTELLQEADDQYIIANAGDETTISFDAGALPVLREGWKRDFLIYSVGWVKDGDLNTALGQTVEPLPFHGMSTYPYGKDEHYPTDRVHQEYQQRYNTREIGTEDFKKFTFGINY